MIIRSVGAIAAKPRVVGLTIPAVISFLAIFSASGATATEYLINGGFDSPASFSGWTASSTINDFVVASGVGGIQAQAGSDWLLVGNLGTPNTISQTFNDIAGQSLLISGWVTSVGSQAKSVTFSFDGQTYVAISPVSLPWTEYSFEVTATGQDSVTVGYVTGSNRELLGLDSFSVTTAVPEPSTWAMMILGFAGVGFMAYRRSRKDQGLALAAT